MPKRKTTPETEVSAAPATEATAAKSRKSAAKPKAASTTAPHKHARKSVKPAEIAPETTPVIAPPVQEAATEVVQEVVQSSARVVTREDIARLAYSYWEARGYQGGSPEEDWLRAERELTVLS